jgi:hypothetical protein
MKTKSTSVFFAVVLCFNVTNAQLVVNEVSANLFSDLVEVKNISGSSLDISTYYICSFPAYEQFLDLVIECEEIEGGGFVLEPGEIITISGHDLGSADGEVGIYTDDQFDDPDFIISYVQYGSAGHEREDEAVAAGVWTAGQFCTTPNFNGGQTLAYDGTGITAADWFTSLLPSPCIENITAIDEFAATTALVLYPNPVTDKLVIESNLSGIVQLINIQGAVVMEFNKRSVIETIQLNDLQPGLYIARIGEQSIRFEKQ